MKKESNPIKSGRRLEVYSDAAKVLDARTMYQHVTLCIKCTALCLRSTHYTTHKQQTCFIIKCSYMENVCACVYSLSNFHIRSQVYVRVYVLAAYPSHAYLTPHPFDGFVYFPAHLEYFIVFNNKRFCRNESVFFDAFVVHSYTYTHCSLALTISVNVLI